MIKLSEHQKYLVICILKDLALQDRDFNSFEAIRIRMVGLKMDLNASKIDEALYEDTQSLEQVIETLAQFETDEQRKFVYQQCLLLMLADRELHPNELEAMNRLQTALNIDKETHNKIKAWVEEGMEWEKRGEALVTANS